MPQQQYPIPAVAVFIVRGREILIGERLIKTTFGKPEWCIPGGKIDFGEKAADAAVREIREETGLRIEILDQIAYSDDIFQDKHFLTMYFQAKAIGGKLVNTEPQNISEWKWVTMEQMPKKMFCNSQLYLPLLKNYYDGQREYQD